MLTFAFVLCLLVFLSLGLPISTVPFSSLISALSISVLPLRDTVNISNLIRIEQIEDLHRRLRSLEAGEPRHAGAPTEERESGLRVAGLNLKARKPSPMHRTVASGHPCASFPLLPALLRSTSKLPQALTL